MRFTIPAAAIAAFLLATDAVAQRGMGGGRWRRPEAITNRVGAFFTDVAGPAVDGDKVADLDTCELVRTAVAAQQLSVLYLVNQGDNEQVRSQFEYQLFDKDEVGIELRYFHCGRIDLAKEEALAARYGKKAPLFVVFDNKGKATELSMVGYKASTTSLTKALEKAAGGAVKPPLPTFAKKYGGLVSDLERLLTKKQQAEQDRAKADNDAKRKKVDKELEQLGKEEEKLLETENKMLEEAHLPERGAGAKRLGERPWRGGGRDGGGRDGGGRGNGGRGNGGGGNGGGV
ncbi:MAG: hypothetical protein KDC98_02050 [Planctomycetes bacterium]|nr:hypothetical protein [Planctomycetota bacterium]